MSEQDWAQEPIICDGGHLKDADGNFLINPDCAVEQATGDRIVACVNACRGIPTDMLADFTPRTPRTVIYVTPDIELRMKVKYRLPAKRKRKHKKDADI